MRIDSTLIDVTDNIQKIQLHYYFNDENKHSMDAFISHKSEGHLLNLIKEISGQYNLKLKRLEFEALSEGSVIKNIIVGLTLSTSVLVPLMQHYLTSHRDETGEYLKKLELIEMVEKRSDENKKIPKHISEYYKTLLDDENIKEVGYRRLDENDNPINDEQEKIVERGDFNKFILEEEQKKESSEEDAKIYLIRVVLNGRGNFSGLYKNNPIEFSIADKSFKNKIKDGEIMFKNGFYLRGKLKITTIVNGKKETTHYELIRFYRSGYDDNQQKNKQLSLF